MSVLKVGFLVTFVITIVWSRQLSFEDYKVFTFQVENEVQLNILQNLDYRNDGYSYWKDPIIGRDADLVVPPNKLSDFEALANELHLNYTLKIPNIQRSVLNKQTTK